MPGNVGHGKIRGSFAVLVAVMILVFGFSPISRALLELVHGSFSPSPFSSLSLLAKIDLNNGVAAGQPVAVLVANHTGHTQNYHWIATQRGSIIRQGEKTVGNGKAAKLMISSKGTRAGQLRVSLQGTDIFVTVTLIKSAS